jgi:NADH:ubiquinone oxidoreductase subunit 4 (subunit M)
MFPEASVYLTPSVYTMSAIATIYVSLTTPRQTDSKKIIAHPPVAHTASVTIGILTYNLQAIEGSIPSTSSHGVVPSASSMCVGASYDRHKTRTIKYYSGLIQVMPLSMSVPPIPTSANPSLPTTGGSVGESLAPVGLSQSNKFVGVLASVGTVSGAAYPIRLRNRIARGNSKIYPIKSFADVNLREIHMFLPLLAATFLIGIYPEVILDTLHMSVKNSIAAKIYF